MLVPLFLSPWWLAWNHHGHKEAEFGTETREGTTWNMMINRETTRKPQGGNREPAFAIVIPDEDVFNHDLWG